MNPMRTYVERRMPLVWKVIMPLNSRGVMLDQPTLKRFQQDRALAMQTWQQRARAHFKARGLGELPIGPKGGFSNPKLRELIYEKLDLPYRLTPKGEITANQGALEALEPRDPTGTITILLENSRWSEARNALQVKPYPDGRVRTRYVLGGDEKWDEDEVGRESPGTGRLASRDPNLQNVPEWVRAIYVPRKKGRWLVKADYSQIEMRLVAHLSGDPDLQKAVDSDAYTHALWITDPITNHYGLGKRGLKRLIEAYKAGDPEVVAARDEMKRIELGWGYRMGAKKMEIVRGIPMDRGSAALLALNRAYPRVPLWWDSLTEEVVRTAQGTGFGYLTNAYGRVRYFFVDDAPAICNFKPQSLAADILFDGMEGVEDCKALRKLDTEMILTVHDELVFDTPDPEATIEWVRGIMERPKPELGGLVIPVKFLVGKNWAKYHEHSKGCGGGCGRPPNPLGQRPWEDWR